MELAMTNDKQVDEWRDQFEKIYAVKDIGAYFSEKDNVYCFYSISDSHNQTKMLRLLAINGSYDGWMTAKRSMQPIELPKPYIDYDEDDNACKYWTKKQINDAITAAGYSYKAKE